MATTIVEPFAPWLRRFNQILHNQGTVSAFIPPADLVSDDDGLTVYPDVPGLRAESLQIELENDTLTIRDERPFPYAQEDRSGPVRRIDPGFGRFERTLRVPARLNPESVQADLHDGALTKRIPKPETVRPRRIEIRAETSGAHEGDSPQRQQEAATAS